MEMDIASAHYKFYKEVKKISSEIMFWILEETNLFEGVWEEKEVCQSISSARTQPDTNRLLFII